MKKKKWLIPIVAFALIVVLLFAFIIVVTNKGYGISQGRYLEAKDGQAMLILDNSPIEMSNRTDKKLYDKLDIGDEILVVHDGIAESYPGKTGVYAVFKLRDGTTGDIPQNVVIQLIELGWLESEIQSDGTVTDIVPGGTPVDESFDIAISYAGWHEGDFVGGLNAKKMAISSVKHLPIYKFDTLSDITNFKQLRDSFTFDQGYDEIPSFNETLAKYDESFFEENSLMVVYVPANSGSYRYGVNSIFCNETAFCVHIEQTNNPEICTQDMSGWFISVAVPDSMIEDCTEFDADLDNF